MSVAATAIRGNPAAFRPSRRLLGAYARPAEASAATQAGTPRARTRGSARRTWTEGGS